MFGAQGEVQDAQMSREGRMPEVTGVDKSVRNRFGRTQSARRVKPGMVSSAARRVPCSIKDYSK